MTSFLHVSASKSLSSGKMYKRNINTANSAEDVCVCVYVCMCVCVCTDAQLQKNLLYLYSFEHSLTDDGLVTCRRDIINDR